VSITARTLGAGGEEAYKDHQEFFQVLLVVLR
jgi:hypothetical protein